MRVFIQMALARTVAALGTLLVLSILLFAASEVIPGDAATASAGIGATAEAVAARADAMGYNDRWPERYGRWISGAARGDLGVSSMTREPVTQILEQPLIFTALLVGIVCVLTVVGASAIGLICVARPVGRLDRVLTATALASVSIPEFVIASFLVTLFAGILGVLPAVSLVPVGGSPLDQPAGLVLPVAVLVLFGSAWAGQLVRAAAGEAWVAPDVEAARLAGLRTSTVIWRHVLPRIAPPCAQAFAWVFGGLFGGTAVVEQVFNYPGVSQILVEAVRNHDAAVLQAVGLTLASAVMAAYLIADLIGLALDPRRRALA